MEIKLDPRVLRLLQYEIVDDDTPDPLPPNQIRDTEFGFGMDSVWNTESFGLEHESECPARRSPMNICECGENRKRPTYAVWIEAHKKAIKQGIK